MLMNQVIVVGWLTQSLILPSLSLFLYISLSPTPLLPPLVSLILHTFLSSLFSVPFLPLIPSSQLSTSFSLSCLPGSCSGQSTSGASPPALCWWLPTGLICLARLMLLMRTHWRRRLCSSQVPFDTKCKMLC